MRKVDFPVITCHNLCFDLINVVLSLLELHVRLLVELCKFSRFVNWLPWFVVQSPTRKIPH